MGQEIDCEARFGGQTSRGRAQLESTALHFRGTFRAQVPLRDLTEIREDAGWLTLTWPAGSLELELGPAAAKWAAKIKQPRSRLDKLGVRAGLRLALFDVQDDVLLAELRASGAELLTGSRARQCDIAFVALADRTELERLERARAAIHPAGAVWALWPKGRPTLREDDVRAFARAHGLVDVKVASVSDVLSGLKLVIPLAQRRGALG